MAETKKSAEEAAVKEAKAQAKRGEPRDEAPVTEKESGEDKKERRDAQATQEYANERLISEARDIFGEPGYVVAAALATEKADKHSVEDTKTLIADYRNRETEEGSE